MRVESRGVGRNLVQGQGMLTELTCYKAPHFPLSDYSNLCSGNVMSSSRLLCHEG